MDTDGYPKIHHMLRKVAFDSGGEEKKKNALSSSSVEFFFCITRMKLRSQTGSLERSLCVGVCDVEGKTPRYYSSKEIID